jgi:hypothetical protein
MTRGKAPSTAKKPPNAFMLFCQRNRTALITDDFRLPASEQSKRLSIKWRELPKPEKDAFRKQADDLDQKLHEQNPDYKYKQKRRPESPTNCPNSTPSSSSTACFKTISCSYSRSSRKRANREDRTSAKCFSLSESVFWADHSSSILKTVAINFLQKVNLKS